jgi:protein-tyrosine-phosphatase
MRPTREPSDLRIWGLAFGYFAFYIPYSGLTKALTQGSLPGAGGRPVTGYSILPATVLATASLLLALITAARGWGQIGRFKVPGLGFSMPSVRSATLLSGLATAVIIATTTLNYTSAGISILLALLLMRGGVLIIAPFVDLSTGRLVSVFSWAAMALSLAAVGLALSSVGSYQMTLVAALNIAAYLGGYVVRLNVMSRLAKDVDPDVNRRYFFEETFVAAVALAVVPALVALAATGTIGSELRAGYLGLFSSPLSAPAILIGLLYGALYMFGTWIYLDPKENTFCIPLNRCSSLLSGVVSSYFLAIVLGAKFPGQRELAGVAFVGAALFILMLETMSRQRVRRLTPVQRVFLFVCGGNTSRSPMAQAICNAEIARRLGLDIDSLIDGPVIALSAGLTATPGRPLTESAIAALRHLGVVPHAHASREATVDLVDRAEVIFCMSEAMRLTLVERFPEARAKSRRLDADADIDDPSGRDEDAYHALAEQLRRLVGASLPALGV